MPAANGEYVKVYLYLLRHAGEEVSTPAIADALELTEGDVRRALLRWQREGLIMQDGTAPDGQPAAAKEAFEKQEASVPAAAEPATPVRPAVQTAPAAVQQAPAAVQTATAAAAPAAQAAAVPAASVPERDVLREVPSARTAVSAAAAMAEAVRESEAVPAAPAAAVRAAAAAPAVKRDAVRETPAFPAPPAQLPDKGAVDFTRLRDDEEFTTLLYIVQRYLSKIFSQTDSETIAYLYDVLGMPAELIEYLAERCAQNGKTSLRYFESIALDWYRKGIRTVDEAKKESSQYTAEVYAVMRAFGLGSRDPGTAELTLIKKWYNEYGFTKELILEACARTLAATQKPSFQYADSILGKWRREGVRTMEDVQRLDAGHDKRVRAAGAGSEKTQKTQTRFHNFEERDDDLDEFVRQETLKKLSGG